MSGFIYFIQADDDGPIKIGWTQVSARRRIAQLQTGCPWPLFVVGVAPGSRGNERALHDEFSADRLCGEWFKCSEKLLCAISEITSAGYEWPETRVGEIAYGWVFDLFGGPARFARIIGVEGFHAQTMKTRDSIPPGYWPRIIKEAAAHNIEGVTIEALAKIAAAKLNRITKAKVAELSEAA